MDRLCYLFPWNRPIHGWYIATEHRAENAESEDALGEIMKAFEGLGIPVIFLVYPRISNFIKHLMDRNQY